jgi:alkanesulfonate monooxygenase SsuD/methylene tetrahydromethanopterin reductase-like flavin-dependent oxidoreductase (luciferase family)
VFVDEREIAEAKAVVDDMRDRAVAQGRSRDSIKIINGVSLIIGDTAEEAAELRRQLTAAPSLEAMAALFLGWSGVDLMAFALDETLDGASTEVGQTLLRLYQGTGQTVREILQGLRETMGGFKVTGTAEMVAEELMAIADATDIDGFLVEFTFGGTESYRDFITTVAPILRERGYLPQQSRTGSLREMLSGSTSSRLPDSHPGAKHRR